jgi:hypothetical protein
VFLLCFVSNGCVWPTDTYTPDLLPYNFVRSWPIYGMPTREFSLIVYWRHTTTLPRTPTASADWLQYWQRKVSQNRYQHGHKNAKSSTQSLNKAVLLKQINMGPLYGQCISSLNKVSWIFRARDSLKITDYEVIFLLSACKAKKKRYSKHCIPNTLKFHRQSYSHVFISNTCAEVQLHCTASRYMWKSRILKLQSTKIQDFYQ